MRIDGNDIWEARDEALAEYEMKHLNPFPHRGDVEMTNEILYLFIQKLTEKGS